MLVERSLSLFNSFPQPYFLYNHLAYSPNNRKYELILRLPRYGGIESAISKMTFSMRVSLFNGIISRPFTSRILIRCEMRLNAGIRHDVQQSQTELGRRVNGETKLEGQVPRGRKKRKILGQDFFVPEKKVICAAVSR